MQYVSLDIETTGLDPKKNQIVEVGAVLTSLGDTTPIEDLPKFRAVIIHEEMQMGSYCAMLHRKLWNEISDISNIFMDQIKEKGYAEAGDTYYCRPDKLEEVFHSWLCDTLRQGYCDEDIKINVAGKNPGTFDIPFLEALPGWQGLIKFHRRVIDPAILCVLPDDEHLPDLQECLKRCGIEKTVSHTAVDDALDIVKILRTESILNATYLD